MFVNVPLDYLNNLERLSLYARMDREILNFEAIFSDETENFVSDTQPSPGDTVTIKLRTGKNNIDSASLHLQNDTLNMERLYSEGLFDYYSADVSVTGINSYYFSISKENKTYFYNKRGLYYDVDHNFDFKILPDFNVPQWVKGAVMYQIFVDRFYNGDKTNDVLQNEYAYLGKAAKSIDDWNEEVKPDDIANFYGGDIQGMMDKMDYFKELGIDAIYLNPIFVSPSSHKYDTQDYEHIDPHFGKIVVDEGECLFFERFNNRYATKYISRTTRKENLEASDRLFAEFIELAHKNGIKVILDGVFNHCGAFNKWLDREGFYGGKPSENGVYPNGAYKDEKSPYHNYFRWFDKNWPNNDCYDGWWGYDNHPKLNFESSKELYKQIMDVAKKWVSPPFNADGWRLDVAADLGYSQEFNHKFWADFRRVVKQANPDAVILAEHYGDPQPWLQGNEWDTVMNYDAFMNPLTWFLTGMEKHSEEYREDMLCNAMAFENSMRYNSARFSVNSLQTAMNELSNHDHSRFLTRTNMTVGRLHTLGARMASIGINESVLMEAVTFQMTWPGAPTIYYGDEVGMTGWTDPDNRRPYPWGDEDLRLLDFHKEIISIHKKYNVFKGGSVEFLFSDYGILSYGRFDKNEKAVVILNNDTKKRELTIPVWRIGSNPRGVFERLILTSDGEYSTQTEKYNVNNGFLRIVMPQHSSVVLLEV